MSPDANHSAYAASPGQGKDSRPRDRHSFALESVGGARYFSTLGLASGYWQVKVDPTDRPKTAFTRPKRVFGLCHAPALFQRLVEHVLSGLQ